MTCWLNVVVATPAHSAIGGALTYQYETSESALSPNGNVINIVPGSLVRVPLGKREVLGEIGRAHV